MGDVINISRQKDDEIARYLASLGTDVSQSLDRIVISDAARALEEQTAAHTGFNPYRRVFFWVFSGCVFCTAMIALVGYESPKSSRAFTKTVALSPWRNSQADWHRHITRLESDPLIRQYLREKQLYQQRFPARR